MTTICHSTASLSQGSLPEQIYSDSSSCRLLQHFKYFLSTSRKFPRTWPGLLAGQTMPHPTAAQGTEGQTPSDLDCRAGQIQLGKQPRRNLGSAGKKTLSPPSARITPFLLYTSQQLQQQQKRSFCFALKGNRNGVLFWF